ncbi:ABC transporter substrate-binding protein [Thermaerobacter composti]|uniref:Penicillin-binding protein activator n=1 Tax=Thermaerobacter composti TaxID=554949 RepID=A0ABZ0QQ40_9FIRM|nr:penicillin-binding protein activator [Thermaerobacter composti]WPD18530.1 penicillin-binding protein activator [Thermaerobacter composti]
MLLSMLMVLILSGCGSQGQSGGGSQQQGGQPSSQGEIKVALLAPQTGTAASSGRDMINGWNLWWEQHGDTVAGRKVVTIVYDTASDPNTAVNQARKAVEQDRVQMVVGPYLANEGLAVAPYLIGQKVPMFLPTVSADDLTQRKRSPYVVRVAGWTSSQTTHPAGEWAYQQGYRRVMTIGNAYAFGYETVGGFARTFTEAGGTIVKQLWAPLGTTDYSPYLSQVQAENPDAVFVEMVGADAVHFLEQWSSLGLKGKVPLIGNETLTDQSNLRNVHGDAGLDIITFGHYAEGRDDPATKEFVETYAKRYGVLPSYMAAAFYTAGQWLTTAIEQVQGNVENTDEFLNSVRSVKLDNSPLGPMEMDEYGNPIQNVYIRKTVYVPQELQQYGRIWNVVLQTYPRVSQFWKYNPDDFLKQPVYSESYQGYGK